MPDDIRLKVGLFTHFKMNRLVRRIGYEGGFKLIQLFAWAAVNRPNGDLSGMEAADIEDAVHWGGDSGKFVEVMREVGFIDGTEFAYRLHDWTEHNPWAASSEERSESSKWAALCRRYGRDGAAERMPGYAERMRSACEPHAAGTAVSENRICPVSDAVTDPVPVTDPASVSVSVSVSDSDTDPSGRVATPLALAPPPAARPRRTGDSKTGATWNAYSAAYRMRYGVDPVRNAKSSALLSQLVDRVGAEDAPQVAAYYVGHNSAYYVGRGHQLHCLVADAEKLRTEWATRRQITGAEARQVERTQQNGDVWTGLLKGRAAANVEQ